MILHAAPTIKSDTFGGHGSDLGGISSITLRKSSAVVKRSQTDDICVFCLISAALLLVANSSSCSPSIGRNTVTSGDLETSISKSLKTCVRMTSPTWCLHPDHSNALSQLLSCILIHAAEMCPVLDAVVSKTMFTMLPLHFHGSSKVAVASEIKSPALLSVPAWFVTRYS